MAYKDKILDSIDGKRLGYNSDRQLISEGKVVARFNAAGTGVEDPNKTDGSVISLVTSSTNADTYAAQFIGKSIRSKQYRTFTGSAAERRLAFYQKKRVLAIVRNLSATETIRIGTTAVDNSNRNPPAYADGVYGTDSPKSKYMLIPPLQAFVTTYDPSQIWSKSTANNNHLCIELWSTP